MTVFGFNATSKHHASVEPDRLWLSFTAGEMGTMILVILPYVVPSFPQNPVAFPPSTQNYYSVITFGITLVLKGKISTNTFKLIQALQLFVAAIRAGCLGSVEHFYVFVAVHAIAVLLAVMIWLVAEPIVEEPKAH